MTLRFDLIQINGKDRYGSDSDILDTCPERPLLGV